ncbi:SapC family protein [Stenotrophomonas sp. NLF4-10]|uniref:SapC family protein n=1 Tax=Stenotrophomonas sp. NLF4-10 TaxID=2918754 RepID=UPI001EFB4E72|nr:SapC family protein [Stenotrophomonas sp. NLF4-10]MCG8274953.1 SapC family protein [Stenotrophomonas sp. NLF4-10]
MSNPVLLNNIDHADLRVITTRGAAWGDDVAAVPTFPGEFRELQAYYPIAFDRSGDGQVQPLVLLGLRQNQNLYLDGERWDAPCLPLAIARQPFFIGVADGEPMVHIDLDHPRVSRDPALGQPLFLEFGGTTPFLQHMASLLHSLHDGMAGNAGFGQALLRHELLEPFTLDVQLDDGSRHRLGGLHTIAEERLRQLDGDALAELARSGHLEAIHMAMASLSQLRGLIERANRRHA